MRLFTLLLTLTFGSGLAVPALAFGTSGSYLAARQASIDSNYEAASEYFARALAMDPNNPVLMENAISATVNLGELERAVPIARRMLDSDFRSQAAGLVIMADQAKNENYAAILDAQDAGQTVGALVDGLARAWALLGDGQSAEALEHFDAVSEEQGLKSYALYHKALALASVGDFEGADAIMSGDAHGPLQLSRRGVQAHSIVLSQLDRNQDAIDLINEVFGPQPAPLFSATRDALEDGQTLEFDMVAAPNEGIGEVYHSVALALEGEAAPGYSLLFARVAEYLNPGHVDASLLSAMLLEELEQYNLATEAYNRVPDDHPAFVSAEIGRADALMFAGREDDAIMVLQSLAEARPDLLVVHVTLANNLRQLERYAEASPAYDRALELIGTPLPQHWVVLFSRGITRERTDRWDEAEADFRKALELNPDQPQVLNYLGYSLVELETNLDEALGMIEKAVEARPNDGYITDSLGWVLYRMGEYDAAVTHMERAVELEPVDPIITDHLGDVYWAVGRSLEAQFQWRRALSFDPEPDEADRIRRKLEVGLDLVLEEEGAPPLAVAKDG